MTSGTMEKIQTVTVPAGGQAAIEFTNIPQTYSDLYILLSLRSNDSRVTTWVNLQPNGSTANGSSRQLYGTGSSAISGSLSRVQLQAVPANNATASTFGSASIYIPNYTSSNNKSFSGDSVSETNATATEMAFDANLWSNSAAITSFKIVPGDGTAWMQHSTATLYGITRVPAGAKATGGVIYDDSSFWYHVFTSSGTFTPLQNITCDYLVVAGGGGGGNEGGGGGAGGFRIATAQSLTNGTNYTITIGGGGATAGGASANRNATLSSFSSFQATGGGGGGEASNVNANGRGGNGGSGGGGAHNIFTAGTGNIGSYSPVEGFDGGVATNTTNNGGGGGGATAVGQAGSGNVGGNGGAGNSSYATWATVTGTGSSSAYAGGGGGWSRSSTAGVGGVGGGGNGGSAANGTAGQTNTGGGGGNGATGGSGIVIVRYAK